MIVAGVDDGDPAEAIEIRLAIAAGDGRAASALDFNRLETSHHACDHVLVVKFLGRHLSSSPKLSFAYKYVINSLAGRKPHLPGRRGANTRNRRYAFRDPAGNWQNLVFGRFAEAVEVTAVQRGASGGDRRSARATADAQWVPRQDSNLMRLPCRLGHICVRPTTTPTRFGRRLSRIVPGWHE